MKVAFVFGAKPHIREVQIALRGRAREAARFRADRN